MVNWYGQRDSYTKESRALITRPDTTMFIQNDVNTYRRIEVPSIMPSADRSSKLGNVARAPAKEGTMTNTLNQAQVDMGTAHYTEVSRTLSESGKSWLITYQGPSGKTHVVSRLRTDRQGRGM